jgi:hypothetical protein
VTTGFFQRIHEFIDRNYSHLGDPKMTFLKKLGLGLAQGIALATGIWPLVSKFFGASTAATQVATTVVNDLTAIGQVVVQAEAMFQGSGTGPSKLAAAAPLVENVIKTSELVAGHKISNEAAFTAACTAITSAVADLLNSLDAGTVQLSGKPVPVGPAPTPTPAA